jgi:hypothetical protein
LDVIFAFKKSLYRFQLNSFFYQSGKSNNWKLSIILLF